MIVMTSLLHAANIYLHYRGGKHVGLAGLIGVIVAIIVISIWPKYIQPIINFTGLNHVAEDMGIVADGFGGAAVTAYNVFIIYLFFCIFFSLIVGIGLLAYVYGSTMLRSKFGSILIGTLIFIPLSPILIWYVVAKSIEINKEKKKAAENPEQYQEEQRLKKNSDIMDYLIRTTEKDGETNQIRKKDAIRYLHRIPSTKESHFLIGITHEREAVLLFPRPFGMNIYGTKNRFIGVPLHFKKFIPVQHDPYGVKLDSPQRYYIKEGEELKQWNPDEIETIVFPKKIYDVQLLLRSFNQSELYKEYVHRACSHFMMNQENKGANQEQMKLKSNVISLKDFQEGITTK